MGTIAFDVDVKPIEQAKKVYTTGEVAALTGLSQQTVIRCFDSGRIGGFRVPGSTSRRIPHHELETFMRDHQIPMQDDQSDASRYRVLLIDDEQQTVDVISQVLEAMQGIGLEVASTAWEAGLLAATTNPDMVIVNARLQDLNMEQVCRSLQELSKPVQVTVLARRFRGEEKDLLRQLGVDSFLRPPLVEEQVIDLLPSSLIM
ncbi:MAG: hypothetical protein CMJ40_01325 [Phycisphaerae bacterium]|nr:hypothetical protein [Phycisphaerae bacterium]